jgi:hypothetical protein
MSIKIRVKKLETQEAEHGNLLLERLNEARNENCPPAPLLSEAELNDIIATSKNPFAVRLARAQLRIGSYLA